MVRRSIKGPHSALTDFLAEHGINANQIRRRHDRRQQQQQQQQQREQEQQQTEEQQQQQTEELPEEQHEQQLQETTITTTTQANTNNEQTPSVRRSQRVSATMTVDALGVHETIPQATTSTQTRTSTSTAQAATTTNAKTKRKKKKNESDDDFSNDDDDDEETALKPTKRSAAAARRGANVAFCSKCRCRYTLTTAPSFLVDPTASSSSSSALCPACANDARTDDVAKVPQKKRRRIATKLTKDLALIADAKNVSRVPSLKHLCLAIIGEHIHDVEALGDLSQLDRDKLSKIISRQRELNNQTARLFLNAGETDLKLFDCTRLNEDGLSSIPMLAPNLTSLTLGFCGQCTGTVTDLIASHLTNLTKLDLHGAFLVKSKSWYTLLNSVPHLTSLSLGHVPRLDAAALKGLSSASNLQELRLSDVSAVDDEALQVITESLSPHALRAFELTRPPNGENNTVPITPPVLMRLIEKIGPGLEELQLTDCGTAVTDEVLVEGIGRLCPRLTDLGISGTEGLTSGALALFFEINAESVARLSALSREGDALGPRAARKYPGPGFERLDFSRLGVPTVADNVGAGLLQALEGDDRGAGDDGSLRTGEGINDRVLAALSRHSAKTLIDLSIDGADGLVHGLEALFRPDSSTLLLRRDEDPRVILSKDEKKDDDDVVVRPSLPELRMLNVSWIRAVDDDALERLGREAPHVERVLVWGCHRVTDCAKVVTRGNLYGDGKPMLASLIGREREPLVAASLGR